MTYRERRQRRAERLQASADRHAHRAEVAGQRAHKMLDVIPAGQPILVGHHSERRHRRDLARIDAALHAQHDHTRTADQLRARADEIERQAAHAIYTDDEDALDRLRARIATAEARRDRMKAINAEIRRGPGWEGRITPPLSEDERTDLLNLARFGAHRKPGYPPCAFQNLTGNLTRYRQRLARLEASERALAPAVTPAPSEEVSDRMRMVMKDLDEDLREVLAGGTIEGRVVRLARQLTREEYLRVDKVLRGLGGRWDRRAKGHIFPFDPTPLVTQAAEAGRYVDRKQTLQLFETPEPVARQMAASVVLPGDDVLEPSAGLGRLVAAAFEAGARAVTAIDIDAAHCEHLASRFHPYELVVLERDFVEYAQQHQAGALRQWDCVLMNPPFANGQDMGHIQAAWALLKPGGRLAAICGEGAFFREDRQATAFRDWLASHDAALTTLPPGTFQDTQVASRLIVMEKPPALERAAEAQASVDEASERTEPPRSADTGASFTVTFVESPDVRRLRGLLAASAFKLWPAHAQAAARVALERCLTSAASS